MDSKPKRLRQGGFRAREGEERLGGGHVFVHVGAGDGHLRPGEPGDRAQEGWLAARSCFPPAF